MRLRGRHCVKLSIFPRTMEVPEVILSEKEVCVVSGGFTTKRLLDFPGGSLNVPDRDVDVYRASPADLSMHYTLDRISSCDTPSLAPHVLILIPQGAGVQ